MTNGGGLFEEASAELPIEQSEATDAVDVPTNIAPAQRERPVPHRRKLLELLSNPKLPAADVPRVQEALKRYDAWIAAMSTVTATGDEKVERLVGLCNDYKRSLEIDLIWDSAGEFLYRQRGQTKLDNSIIEEFLPWLVDPAIIPALAAITCMAGPRKAFAAASFLSTLVASGQGGGLRVRSKDQDFAVSRQAFLQSSFSPDFPDADTTTHTIHLAYVAAECKTNLDKTMFQEASATAHDLKIALPSSRYFLIAEYLDMTPISTAGSDIDEVLILRGRRMGAHLRKNNSNPEARASTRHEYETFIDSNPIRFRVILRFVDHVRTLLADFDPAEADVLERGYF